MEAAVQERRQENSLSLHTPGLDRSTRWSGAACQSHRPSREHQASCPLGHVSSPSLLLPYPGYLGFPGGARPVSPEPRPSSQDFTLSVCPLCLHPQNPRPWWKGLGSLMLCLMRFTRSSHTEIHVTAVLTELPLPDSLRCREEITTSQGSASWNGHILTVRKFHLRLS